MRTFVVFAFILPFCFLACVCLLHPTVVEHRMVVTDLNATPPYVLGIDILTGDSLAVMIDERDLSSTQLGDTLVVYYVQRHSSRVQGAILETAEGE